jgi:hypothetical protein
MKKIMIEVNISKRLADCLDWIQKTGGSIEDAASRYPNYCQELTALLRTAECLKKSVKISPSPQFKAAAWTRLLNQINTEDTTPSTPLPL